MKKKIVREIEFRCNNHNYTFKLPKAIEIPEEIISNENIQLYVICQLLDLELEVKEVKE